MANLKKWSDHEDRLVDQIVINWNKIVRKYENQTIKFAVVLEEMLKAYPEDTAKQIIHRVKKHPELKPTISVDRIYQGWRLVRNRPDIAKYVLEYTPEQLKGMPEDMKPILKKDGSVAVEHYFELYKRPGQIDEGMKLQLEQESKQNSWTVMQLKDKINNINSKADPTAQQNIEKARYIKMIIGVLRTLSVKEVKEVYDEVVEKKNASK